MHTEDPRNRSDVEKKDNVFRNMGTCRSDDEWWGTSLSHSLGMLVPVSTMPFPLDSRYQQDREMDIGLCPEQLGACVRASDLALAAHRDIAGMTVGRPTA